MSSLKSVAVVGLIVVIVGGCGTTPFPPLQYHGQFMIFDEKQEGNRVKWEPGITWDGFVSLHFEDQISGGVPPYTVSVEAIVLQIRSPVEVYSSADTGVASLEIAFFAPGSALYQLTITDGVGQKLDFWIDIH